MCASWVSAHWFGKGGRSPEEEEEGEETVDMFDLTEPRAEGNVVVEGPFSRIRFAAVRGESK